MSAKRIGEGVILYMCDYLSCRIAIQVESNVAERMLPPGWIVYHGSHLCETHALLAQMGGRLPLKGNMGQEDYP